MHTTTINRVNLNNVRNYVMSQAGDANRTDYNLANTCATQAIKAIIAGLGVTNYAEAVARSSGHWLNPMNWVREGQKLI